MLRAVFGEFLDDDAPRLAAALSYYAIFALPPLLVVILVISGFFLDPDQVQRWLEEQFGAMIGPEAGGAIRTIIENAQAPDSGGFFATALGVGALLFGATGAFAQLQRALNTAWEVEPKEGGVRGFLTKRVLSFGMILGVGFLLLVSLLLSAVLSAFGSAVAEILPRGLSGLALQAINYGFSLAVITLLFAAMFKVLPDAEIAWRDVWIGAGVTAVLFMLAQFLLAFYIGRSDPGSAYGAAGAVIILLLWVYVSSLIVLLGAEFTQVWARRQGRRIQPEAGAVRVVKKRRHEVAEQQGPG